MAAPILVRFISLFTFIKTEGTSMPIATEIQAQLDAIKLDIAAIPDAVARKVTAAEAAANAQAAQDNADTLAAVTQAATALHSAVSV
jgi:hypothetical protein